MKYMGSKRFMLNNGLGKLIRDQLPKANRVIDPFCGAGSVIYFVAQNFSGPIIASDLQKYAVVLAEAVIGRNKKIDPKNLEEIWLSNTKKEIMSSRLYYQAVQLEKSSLNIRSWSKKSKQLCKKLSIVGPVWNAYGGYYFSPKQALIFDYLLKSLPKDQENKSVCLAAIIIAAARCVASPGHTAQPFKPNKTAGKYLKIAWEMDPFKACEKALKEICPVYANRKGSAMISDAKGIVNKLKEGDLVILDPPYSGVQYSRFYHVLETIARGKCGPVEGIGRYPSLAERPQSAFSNAGQSLKALNELMAALAKKKVNVIFTFPKGKCSNGLSGDTIKRVVKKWFSINKKMVHGHFSTLGGNNHPRASRVKSEELLLLLKPLKSVFLKDSL